MPVSKLKCDGDCAFSIAGLSFWNRLPGRVKRVTSLGMFKSVLKMHPFKAVGDVLHIFPRKRFCCTPSLNGFASKGT